MSPAARYRPNTPPVVQETIDNETIMVNLDTGTYYSLDRVGSFVWTALEAGASAPELVAAVAGHTGADQDAAEQAVGPFVGELVAEGLIVEQDGAAEPPALPDWPAGVPLGPPKLTRYTDMQELLLLDPVHDVGVAGWPEAR